MSIESIFAGVIVSLVVFAVFVIYVYLLFKTDWMVPCVAIGFFVFIGIVGANVYQERSDCLAKGGEWTSKWKCVERTKE